MANSHSPEFMLKNPHCAFCKHSYIKFFSLWCDKKNSPKNLCAKNCLDYEIKTEEKKG